MSSRPTAHRARKRFGQNFLRDPGVISRIVRSIGARPGDRMVEIGPGQGALTEPLLDATDGDLEVIELDRDLIPVLRTKFFNYPEFRIHEADALSFDFSQLVSDRPLRIVGNLPYNISTPLIVHSSSPRFRRITVWVESRPSAMLPKFRTLGEALSSQDGCFRPLPSRAN